MEVKQTIENVSMSDASSTEFLQIDGASGEGGGQIVRSSLALSAITGQPIEVINVRGGRRRPGLMRQHLTSVMAATEVCSGEVTGADLGSKQFRFVPGEIAGGEFHFRIGTAGSTTLVAQTILPALSVAQRPSTVVIEGGTHNAWAPPCEFLQHVFLPQLAKLGPRATLDLESHGFYPAGGGRIRLQVTPGQQWSGLELISWEEDYRPQVTAIVSRIVKTIGQRECDTVRRKLRWDAEAFHVREVSDAVGPGNVVLIELQRTCVSECFMELGKPGLKAEHVARNVARQAQRYLARRVPVGEYLADQLLLPMAQGAAVNGVSSRFRTGALTLHARTQIELIPRFLPVRIEVEEPEQRESLVSVVPR